ncbi:hypothetical protein ACFCYC_07995 [Streptomyces sp. NPDC056402]|uniref:hypothetical protein n=1 Tax=Streptomyces sp. NPDC056402 TaxID=3345810 RepID=UPI0035D8DA7B
MLRVVVCLIREDDQCRVEQVGGTGRELASALLAVLVFALAWAVPIGEEREDIAANGLSPVEGCTPWEELREAHLARLAAQRPVVA